MLVVFYQHRNEVDSAQNIGKSQVSTNSENLDTSLNYINKKYHLYPLKLYNGSHFTQREVHPCPQKLLFEYRYGSNNEANVALYLVVLCTSVCVCLS